jgi:hypothetical protein
LAVTTPFPLRSYSICPFIPGGLAEAGIAASATRAAAAASVKKSLRAHT